MGNYKHLSELLFGHIDKTAEHWEEKYPPRNMVDGAAVTRLGPSPTGFIHLGNLYTAFMNEKLSKQTGGLFYLRIEDTDDKREVEGAAESLITTLDFFGIDFDEGVTLDGETGDYGPYYQSDRKEIYQTYVKELIAQGKAYPCFLTEDEINKIREEQESGKLMPGIYGKWAKYRDTGFEEIESKIKADAEYVIRYKSAGDPTKYFKINDDIRGEVSMPENEIDVVLLKSNGIPTYHMAHVIDDHLMRTTHVFRGEEWLSSLPIHVALSEALGFELPIYCHTTVLMKMDGETKRKLSKRKDPELSLEYYKSEGYHPKAISEYLMTIINSNFEEWRMENPDESLEEFTMETTKMGHSGILFDLDKLTDVSKETLVRIPADELADFVLGWITEYEPEKAAVISGADNELYGKEYLIKALDIGRTGDKPRKDLAYGKQIIDFISYFYDEYFKIEDQLPANITAEDVPVILNAYIDTYVHSDPRDVWFEKIRTITADNGYAVKPKDFKKNPDDYKGHVGDVSGLIRLAIVGRSNSPDIWEIQQILGEDRVRDRIRNFNK